MIRSFVGLFALILLLKSVTGLSAAPMRHLDNEVEGLLKRVVTKLNTDNKLNGMTFSLGSIGSVRRPSANYGPELRRIFEKRLKAEFPARFVPEDGKITIVVNYDFALSEKNRDEGIKVLFFRVQFQNEQGEISAELRESAEVNDSADISRVFGLTVAPRPADNQADRLKEVEKSFSQNSNKPEKQITPTFQVKHDTRVGIPGDQKFFVEILVKDRADGPSAAVKPVPNAQGNAFVDLRPNQFYEIRLHNEDEYDCVAQIRIDGQDALNRFNADAVTYPGLLIPAKSVGQLRGWMHTVKPRPVEKDNVFAFAVKGYGDDKKPLPPSGEIGVITVQFAVAWKEGTMPPAGRSTGQFTDRGEGLKQDFQVERRHIGTFNETISIRYSHTAQ